MCIFFQVYFFPILYVPFRLSHTHIMQPSLQSAPDMDAAAAAEGLL